MNTERDSHGTLAGFRPLPLPGTSWPARLGAAREPCRHPATPQARALLGGSSSPASVGRGHMTQKRRRGRLPHPQGLGSALGTRGSTHGWYQFPSPCGLLPRRYHELGLVSNRHVFLVVRQLEVQGRGPPDPASRGKPALGSGTAWLNHSKVSTRGFVGTEHSVGGAPRRRC